MTARQSNFLKLYLRYRVDPYIEAKGQQARHARLLRARLLISATASFAAAAAAEALAATKVAVALASGLAVACAVAGLALASAIIASASVAGEATRVGRETRDSLDRAHKTLPGPDASDLVIADWVQQLEIAGLQQADPGPDTPGTS